MMQYIFSFSFKLHWKVAAFSFAMFGWLVMDSLTSCKTCQPVPSSLFLASTIFSFFVLGAPQVLSDMVATRLPSLSVELIHPSPSASKVNFLVL